MAALNMTILIRRLSVILEDERVETVEVIIHCFERHQQFRNVPFEMEVVRVHSS